jgi:hypothetical protein
MTRDPNPGRRDRAEPLANPARQIERFVMRWIPRGLGVIVAGALVLGTAAPVSAEQAPPGPQIQVTVEVEGYARGRSFVSGTIGCQGLPENISFGVGVDDGSGISSYLEAPAGLQCSIGNVSPGDPGAMGRWGAWTVEPGGWVTIPDGDGVTLFIIRIERLYNGAEPDRDAGTWFTPDVFTVDRVYLNRTGGISAEGRISCRTLVESVFGADSIIGINWAATQYVGRRTAIHGSYGSDIGKRCYDPANPSTPVRWTSEHPAPGDTSTTAWVYAVDGKFASGTIIIEADSYNQMTTITQWWDPDCSTEPQPDGWYDANGDGFCAFYNEFGLRITAALKTTTVRTK